MRNGCRPTSRNTICEKEKYGKITCLQVSPWFQFVSTQRFVKHIEDKAAYNNSVMPVDAKRWCQATAVAEIIKAPRKQKLLAPIGFSTDLVPVPKQALCWSAQYFLKSAPCCQIICGVFPLLSHFFPALLSGTASAFSRLVSFLSPFLSACCWVLLGAVGCCWVLLGAVGCCWVLLGAVGCCWVLLGAVSASWRSSPVTCPFLSAFLPPFLSLILLPKDGGVPHAF